MQLIGDQAAKVDLRIDFTFTDLGETWSAWIQHGVLNARRRAHPETQLTVSGPKAALTSVLLSPATATKLMQAGTITLTGDHGALDTLAGLLDAFDPNFNMVTP